MGINTYTYNAPNITIILLCVPHATIRVFDTLYSLID